MKISYILQLKDFFIMICLGGIIGIFYGIINTSTQIKKKIILQVFNDLIFSIVTCATFIISINTINLGQFRLFLTLGYFLGFIIERITLGKLFAKGYKFVYNKTVKLLKKFANSKLGKVILK